MNKLYDFIFEPYKNEEDKENKEFILRFAAMILGELLALIMIIGMIGVCF